MLWSANHDEEADGGPPGQDSAKKRLIALTTKNGPRPLITTLTQRPTLWTR